MEPFVADTYNSCILCKNTLIEKKAYLMPCIHTICEDCLKVPENSEDAANIPPISVSAKLAEEITCTDCKEKFQVTDLVENLLTRRPTELPIVIEEVEKHICTGCDDSIEATSHCEDCSEWLCDQCVFAHKRVKITKDHTITGKNKTSSKDGSFNEAATFCKIHKQEKFMFFCEICDMLTCRDCQLMDHKDHKFQYLAQAAADYKEQADKISNVLKTKKDTLKQSAAKIQEKLAYVKSQKDIVRDEVQLQARKLVEHVIENAKQILQNLNFVCDAAGKRLSQEGAEASAMLQKLEHMSTFLKSIKNESNDLSLLYTKKLILKQASYLAQVNLELYSLRGQLNLEYRHDAQFFFQNIQKLGMIFVNGLRYPPAKNQPSQPQQMIPQVTHNGSSASAVSEEQRKAMAAFAIHRAAARQQQMQQYNAIQFNQQQNRPNNHSNNQNTLLRNSQQTSSLPFNWQSNANRGLASQNVNSTANIRQFNTQQALMMQHTSAHHQPGQQQTFQPMRLNTRPVASNVTANMQMQQPLTQWNGSRSSGNSPGAAGINSHEMHSSNGKSTTDDDFYDCIITAAKIKGQKLEGDVGVFTGDGTNTINLIDDADADNVLSDVLKNMPIELTESSSSQNFNNNTDIMETTLNTPPPRPITPVTPATEIAEIPKESTDSKPQERSRIDLPTETISAPTVSSSLDPNEDYCACCHNGGDVLCCDKCPRVYHLHCHIPPLQCVPPGVFVCLLCEDTESVTTVEETESDLINGGSKRKAPSGISDKELKTCEKVLLELFCHQQSVAFHEPVGRNVLNYHKIVLKPQDFTTIKCKLARQHFNHYRSVEEFLSDINQVFLNCDSYNAPASEVGKSGKVVRKFLHDLIKKHLPAYIGFDQKSGKTSPAPSTNTGSSSPKRLRLDDQLLTS